ncbi:MAG: zinc-dependent alcohol dehydrogenase family protein [Pseudoruegeria sp.]
MTIIQFSEHGNPVEVLKTKSVSIQEPNEGEVRVKILATPIHPANLLQVAGQYGSGPELPAIPGAEGVGEVVEVGAGVDHLKPGLKVLLTGLEGTWRTEVTASAQAFTPAPPGNVEQLAMLAVNPVTAHLLLTTFTELSEGDWILQSAANSAVGELVSQLAALRGFNVVNVVRRPELLGKADQTTLLDGPDLAQRVAAVTGDVQIKLALDSVGGETFERLVEATGYGGTVVNFGNLSGKNPQLDLGRLISKKIDVRGFWLQDWYQTAGPEKIQAALGALISLIASGQLVTKIDSRYPLEEIKQAVVRAMESGRDGKVLLTPLAQ